MEFPNGLKIKMDKKTENGVAPVVSNKVINNIQAENTSKEEENYKIIKSPMVGTFYTSSSPKAEPFVKVGDKIKKGQVVCIVEAMKLMNQIESEFSGKITEICVQDGQAVEYGQTIMYVE